MTLLIVLGLVAIAGFFGWLGYLKACDELRIDRMQVEQERHALDAEWRSLEQTQRVRAVFLDARRAMQVEAARTIHQRGGKPHGRR